MKTLFDFLPKEWLTEAEEESHDSVSPISGQEAYSKTNPTESKDGVRELQLGDPVIIKGRVMYTGMKGKVVDFGQDKHFVVVDIKNHGRHSFHSSDVTFDDYADMGEDDDEHDEVDNLRRLAGYQ